MLTKFDAPMSAVETARLVREKQISPVEVTRSTIARIEARNPSLNAFVHQAFDEALGTARSLEQKIVDGESVGALAGVPTAMKDLWNFKPGWPATFGGIPALKDFKAPFSSTYPRRMEEAGAILLGATNSPIMGFRGACDNPLFGATSNPFDTSRNSGGSSGGSAAAVADGLVPVAGATDAGGSIRIPAAWCGVYGYQPSFGRVPLVMRPNAFAASAPFIYEGPVSRTVADAALVMSVLAGQDPADPFTYPGDVDWLGALNQSIKGLRIGFSPDLGVYPVDPAVAEMVQQAVAAFELAGAEVVPVDITIPHSQQELSDLWCRMICAVSASAFDGFRHQGVDLERDFANDLPERLLEGVAQARKMSLAELQADQAMRTTVYDALQTAFSTVDLIVTPTVAALPVLNESRGSTVGPNQVAGQAVDPLIGWCMTYFTNFSGHPAASCPAGLANGLPVGLQIIGRRWADATVLAASAAFEAARPWAQSYDICATRSLA